MKSMNLLIKASRCQDIMQGRLQYAVHRLNRASVVLGSATPSVEAFSWCQGGSCTMLELKNRATRQVMPKVYTVDMREELKNGNRSILSDRLTELMEKCLSEHHQMMLFLNRRGYAGFVSCRFLWICSKMSSL